jgi:hypothetical protein
MQRQNAEMEEHRTRKQWQNESIDAAMEEMEERMRLGFGRSQSLRGYEQEKQREREKRYDERQYYQ